MQSSNEVMQRMSTKMRFTNFKISKVSFQSYFTPRMSVSGIVGIETFDKVKSLCGVLTVLDLITTKAFVFL